MNQVDEAQSLAGDKSESPFLALLPCPFCGKPTDSFKSAGHDERLVTCNDDDCPASDVICTVPEWNARASAWRPIETAPKDGTFVLLLGDSGYTGTPHRVAVGQWVQNYKDCWTNHAGDRFTDDGQPPTHWMPLLPAPEKEQS